MPGHLPSVAGRRLMVVACSVPALSRVPRAFRHLPAVIASVLAEDCLVYLVLSSTVTGVCWVLPLASVVVTVMVLPVTEATAPRTGCACAGAVVGEPEGAGLLEPGPAALGCGQVPLTEGLTRTAAAVTGCPWAAWLVGRTVPQLPVGTSVSVAGRASVILVVEVKFTAAWPLSSLVTWIELPATDAIRPLTLASPAGAGDVVVEVTVEVEVDVDVGLALFDEPHAAMDSAAAPETVRMANRVNRGT